MFVPAESVLLEGRTVAICSLLVLPMLSPASDMNEALTNV